MLHYVMMFTTRAASIATMISEVVACSIITTFVRGETNWVWVTLKAGKRAARYWMMFTTRAASNTRMTSEVSACTIIRILVRAEINCVLVTLKATLVLNARKR